MIAVVTKIKIRSLSDIETFSGHVGEGFVTNLYDRLGFGDERRLM